MKTPRLFATLTLATLALTSAAQARSLNDILKDGTLRVATAADIPPFGFASGNTVTGFEVDLITAVAADMGLKVKLVPAPIDQLSKLLNSDSVDVAMSAQAITSTRENRVDFTTPTSCSAVSMVSTSPKLKTHTDLAGKTIVVGSGSIMQSFVQKLPFEKKVSVVPTSQDVMFSMISGQADATFMYSAMQPAIKQMFPKATLYFGPELWSVPQGLMIHEDATALRLRLNAGIQRLLGNGKYAAISTKYFGKDVRCK